MLVGTDQKMENLEGKRKRREGVWTDVRHYLRVRVQSGGEEDLRSCSDDQHRTLLCSSSCYSVDLL